MHGVIDRAHAVHTTQIVAIYRAHVRTAVQLHNG